MTRRRRTDLRRSGGFIGMGGLAPVLFLDLASAAFLPWWAVVLLVVLWTALLLVGTRWFTPRPLWVLALPVAGLAAWLLAVRLVADR